MKINIILIIVSLITCCTQQDQPNQNAKGKTERFIDSLYEFSDKSQDSIIEEFFQKHSEYPKQTLKNRILPNSFTYGIKKKLNTDFMDLKFELRSYSSCGGCWTFEFIYIYNDTTNFILPLSDYYYYWRMSTEKEISNSDSIYKSKLNFEDEINKLMKILKINSAQDEEFIIDIIMKDFLNSYLLTVYDFKKLKEIAEYISNDSIYNLTCRKNIIKNIEKVERIWSDSITKFCFPREDHTIGTLYRGNCLLYTNGVLIYIFDFNENKGKKVNFEVINCSCMPIIKF